MKLKDKQQLHQLIPKQLQAKLQALSAQLVNTRLKLKAGQLKDIHAPAKIRRQIAIIKTILTEKETK